MKANRCAVLILMFCMVTLSGLTSCLKPLTPDYTPASEISSSADQQYEEGVIRSTANLRQGPSMQSSIISRLSPGTAVKIIERQGDWYRILWDTDSDAYVHSSLVKLSPSTVSPDIHESLAPVTTPRESFDPEKILTTTRGCNLRNGPGTEYDPPAAFIRAGAEFVVSGRTGNWYYGTAQGRTGWIHNSLLSEEGYMSDPGTKPPVETKPFAQQESTEAHVSPPTPEVVSAPDQVPDTDAAPPVRVTRPAAAGKGRISSVDPVKIRMQPSTFARVTGEAAPGQAVQIMGCEGSWCEIKIANATGYVLSINLSQEGN